jgi:hypothetical protein
MPRWVEFLAWLGWASSGLVAVARANEPPTLAASYGRPPVAHGSPEMPVWGEVLRMEPGGGGDPGGGDPRAVELKLVKIVEYLRSIQAK